jgi:hypothetical protein
MTDSTQTVQLLQQIADLLAAILTLLQHQVAKGGPDLTSAVKAAGDAAITYKLLFPH